MPNSWAVAACSVDGSFRNVSALYSLSANAQESAFLALGFAGRAGVSPVENEPMVGAWDERRRDVAHQFSLDGIGCGASWRDKADAMGNTEDVGIYSHGGFVEGYALNDVGRLATYAGKFQQVLHRLWNLTAEVGQKHSRHAYEVLSLVVGIGYAFDVFVDNFRRSLGHDISLGVVGEKRRRYEVHALIGALGTEYDGYEQLERRIVMEFRFRIGHCCLEITDDAFVEFLISHCGWGFAG